MLIFHTAQLLFCVYTILASLWILLYHQLQSLEPNMATSTLIAPHRWFVLEVYGPALVKSTLLQMQRMVAIKNGVRGLVFLHCAVCLMAFFFFFLFKGTTAANHVEQMGERSAHFQQGHPED